MNRARRIFKLAARHNATELQALVKRADEKGRSRASDLFTEALCDRQDWDREAGEMVANGIFPEDATVIDDETWKYDRNNPDSPWAY